MTIEEIWALADTEGGTLTFDQFMALAKENNAKFADVKSGEYVSVNKYNTDLKAKDTEIGGLNETLKQRDTDLQDLQTKLQDAGTDAEKLSTLSNDLSSLQTKYDTDTKSLQEQLNHQRYEFAVREFAGTKEFTSNAAKRDFVNSMIARGLKMSKDGDSIIGADDFVAEYSQENADAFVTYEEPEGDFEPEYEAPLPSFVASTQGDYDPSPDPTGGFMDAFHFTTVRPVEE